jgi:hypothetical protein
VAERAKGRKGGGLAGRAAERAREMMREVTWGRSRGRSRRTKGFQGSRIQGAQGKKPMAKPQGPVTNGGTGGKDGSFAVALEGRRQGVCVLGRIQTGEAGFRRI